MNELGPITERREAHDSQLPEDRIEPEGLAPSEASLGRKAIGIDLDEDSAKLTAERMGQPWLYQEDKQPATASADDGRLF